MACAAHRRSESFSAGQRRLLERIAAGAPLPGLLADIVRLVEGGGDMLCSILLVDSEHRCVRHGAAPSLPAAYVAALDGAAIGPEAGSCGTAAHHNRTVVVEDIDSHPYWRDYKQLALPHGLRACWSSPISSAAGEVLGTFAMYYRECRAPTPLDRRRVKAATHLALIAILRDRAEQALRRSEARARQLARLYALSSAVDDAIVRARDPQELYELACRLVVQEGFARFAWVGLHEVDDSALRPAAAFGEDGGYIDLITLDLADPCVANGPAGRVFATGTASVCGDIEHDPGFYWKDEALARCLRACAVFPLRCDGRISGVFAIYLGHAHKFSDEELRVLNALAENISFALDAAERAQQRRRADCALRRSEDRLRAVIENTPNVAIQWYDHAGRVLFCNQATLRLLGWSADDCIGKTLDALNFPAQEAARFSAAIDKVAADGLPVGPVEFNFRHPDGGIGTLLSTVFRIPYTDDEDCFVCMDVDLTERKRALDERQRLEVQLHQSQRLQSLGTLAGGIAHDFNNITTAIAGNADLACGELAEDHPAREHLVRIRAASRHAADLVRQILAFSRCQEPRREVVDLRQLIPQSLRLLQPNLTPRIRVVTEFAADTPLVLADATQFQQIIVNLGTNALHAMCGKAGEIRVTTASCCVHADQPTPAPELSDGSYAVVSISDNGCGIDPAVIERVFEPFFTTRDTGQGTGLGLSVVHGIVRSHGGAITVDSKPGEGARFRLYLPAAGQPEMRPDRSEAARSTQGHGEHVLYVDDDDALVFLIGRLLRRLGYRVSEHTDPIRALQAFRDRPGEFDAVVTDVSMHGLSGPQLAREIRAIRPDIPIVMTSGYIREEDLAAAEALGIKDLLLKPDTIDELGRALHRLLTG